MASSTRTTSIIAVSSAIAAGSLLAYVIYFDYKRRNDAEFRRKLRAEKKQVEKKAQKHAEETKEMEARSLTMSRDEFVAMHKKCKEELANVPADQKSRMDYCLSMLSAADQMINDISMFKTAAVLYFKVLCIYPSPLDLIGMYDSNLPKPVMEMVMELYNIEVSETYLAQMLAATKGGEDVASGDNKSPSETSSHDWDKVST